MKQFYILIAILFFNSIKLEAQTFINGSFENTTSSGCDYNNSNSEFNSKMENVYAFGTAQEVDIKRINCFIPSIPDGDVALAINVQPDGDFDAIALELTSPLISGNRYTISFKAHGNRTFSPNDAN